MPTDNRPQIDKLADRVIGLELDKCAHHRRIETLEASRDRALAMLQSIDTTIESQIKLNSALTERIMILELTHSTDTARIANLEAARERTLDSVESIVDQLQQQREINRGNLALASTLVARLERLKGTR